MASFRFIGDGTDWQTKNGLEKMEAPKKYVVEVKTSKGEHLLFSFELVYDWLVYCHMVTSVRIFSTNMEKHFPGADDADLNADI